MPQLLQSRYSEGQALYSAGQGIGYIVNLLDEIERHRNELLDAIGSRVKEPDPAKQDDIAVRHQAIYTGEFGHNAGPSLIAGFADGFLADIRLIAGHSRPGRTA